MTDKREEKKSEIEVVDEKEKPDADLFDEQEEKKQKLEHLAEMEKARQMADAFDLPVGRQAYLNDVPNSGGGETIDWSAVLDKGLAHLDKAFSGKTPDDIVLMMCEAFLLAPLDMLTDVLKQHNKNTAETIKKARSQRQSYIENNLKNNGSSLVGLASQLSSHVQNWLLNDPEYRNLPGDGLYNKRQKAVSEKQRFANKLPKLTDGNIDFSRMSRAQKRRFATYVAYYTTFPRWRQYVNEMCGLRINENEYNNIRKTAMQVKNIRLPYKMMTNSR